MISAEDVALEFESHRGYLTAVAYGMLGTLADAEDAVQETYLPYEEIADTYRPLWGFSHRTSSFASTAADS